MVAYVPLGTVARQAARTMEFPNPALVPRVVQPYPAPVVIRRFVARAAVRGTVGPPRTLLRRRSLHEPIAVSVPRVAVRVREALHAVLVTLALLRPARGTVLPTLTVGIVPLVPAEILVLGTARPDRRADGGSAGESEQCRKR